MRTPGWFPEPDLRCWRSNCYLYNNYLRFISVCPVQPDEFSLAPFTNIIYSLTIHQSNSSFACKKPWPTFWLSESEGCKTTKQKMQANTVEAFKSWSHIEKPYQLPLDSLPSQYCEIMYSEHTTKLSKSILPHPYYPLKIYDHTILPHCN